MRALAQNKQAEITDRYWWFSVVQHITTGAVSEDYRTSLLDILVFNPEPYLIAKIVSFILINFISNQPPFGALFFDPVQTVTHDSRRTRLMTYSNPLSTHVVLYG